jgi:succinyl-diaminopimelate desuccinylase
MEFVNAIINYKDDIIKDVQRLVRIKSVDDMPKDGMPFGEGIAKALSEALEISGKLGFSTYNLDGYAGYAEAGQGEEIVGILVHLDVVPEGEGWDVDPYGALIQDGKIYGRGTSDDKAPAIASLYALKAVLDSGVKLNKRVRIIFGTNEEKNCEGIQYYIKKEGHVDIGFTPDANFPLIHGEKAIMQGSFVFTDKGQDIVPCLVDIKGGDAVNMVADQCEAVLCVEDEQKLTEQFNNYLKKNSLDGQHSKSDQNIILKICGKSSHGSRPKEGLNAISHMAAFLNKITLNKGAEFAAAYCKKIGFAVNGENMQLDMKDEFGRLTFCVGMIKMENDSIIVSSDIRYPITVKQDEIARKITNALENTDIVYKLEHFKDAIYIKKDSYLVETLMDAYIKVMKDKNSKPFTIGGGTYARAMKNILGFGMLFCGQEDTMHKKNEYVKIESLLKAATIYAEAIYKLATQ